MTKFYLPIKFKVTFCVQGVISPLLSNLFLHYVFDVWMGKHHPGKLWCRYADDGLAHCKTEEEAQQLLADLNKRFESCGLELHPEKTKIIYCKDSNRKSKHSVISFDFLGYTFKPRLVRSCDNKMFVAFTPAVSASASKAMRDRIRQWKLKYRVELSLEEIAAYCNPVLTGWMQYYGKYSPSSLEPIWTQFNAVLVKWGMRKYKKINGKTRSAAMLEAIQQKKPALFSHWKIGIGKSFA